MSDLIKRPFDEEYDTMMAVERNPCGAWMAIQAQADRIEELNERLTAATNDAKEAEAYAEELDARNKELTLQLLATSGQAADALDKLTKAMAFIRRHIPDSVYEQRQRANAFLAELEGKND